MLTRGGPKLLDFGIANSATCSETARHLPRWMRPEPAATWRARWLELRPTWPRTTRGTASRRADRHFAFGSSSSRWPPESALSGTSTAAWLRHPAEPRPQAPKHRCAHTRSHHLRVPRANLTIAGRRRDLLRELRWGKEDLKETRRARSTRLRTVAVHAAWRRAAGCRRRALVVPRAAPGDRLPPNQKPVIVLMDSRCPAVLRSAHGAKGEPTRRCD